MKSKIKNLSLALMIGLMTLLPSFTTIPAFATASSATDLCNGINSTSGSSNTCSGNTTVSGTVGSLAKTVVNIFSYIVGIVAVLMLIFSGFRYITSGGDSNKVGSAKNTLVYAIVGIIIVIAAQVIISFVVNTASNAVNG